MANIRKSKIKKIVYSSIFAALSAGISLFFSYLIPLGASAGLPLYAIPLIMASIILGPGYGFLVSFVADLAIGFMGPYGYMPLYMISTISWGVISGLFIKRKDKYNLFILLFSVFYSYLIASLGNSFANFIYFGKKTFFATLPIRLFNMLLFTPVITWLSHILITEIILKDSYLIGFRVKILHNEKS